MFEISTTVTGASHLLMGVEVNTFFAVRKTILPSKLSRQGPNNTPVFLTLPMLRLLSSKAHGRKCF